MKYSLLILIILLFGCTFSSAQKKQCFCAAGPTMNGSSNGCATKKLSNGAKLYWQYTCKRIWFTLETAKRKKIVIDEIPIDLGDLTFRLGFHFIKEFNRGVLFRGGCPANGPCNYTLIDKNNGRVLKRLNQLIRIDTEAFSEPAHPYEYDFVVYFSAKYDRLIVLYIDSNKHWSIPFDAEKNGVSALTPEYQFKKMTLKDSVLTLFYVTGDNENKQLNINLKNGKYSRR